MSSMVDSSSEDGNMSDYDFVEVEVSDTDTVTSSLAPPKGWSTLSLSDAADGVARVAVVATEVEDTPCGRREFISSRADVTPDNAVFVIGNESSTRFQPGIPGAPLGGVASFPRRQQQQQHGELQCPLCRRLLRDCVECPIHHTLFCREHLRVDSKGKSPCPCAKCCPSSGRAPISTPTTSVSSPSYTSTKATAPKLHPLEAFVPNIPVQRMADAVPSSCDGCGASLSWGELGLHTCDQQLVPCDASASGCYWFGQRRRLAEHASTCRLVQLKADEEARHERVVTEARKETSDLRAELAIARERASSAEMRASELEERLSRAEDSLRRAREEVTDLVAKKADLQAELRDEKKKAATAAAVAAAAAVKRVGEGASLASSSSSSDASGAPVRPSAATVATPAAAAAPPTTFGAMFNRAGISLPVLPQHAVMTTPLAVPGSSGGGKRGDSSKTGAQTDSATTSRARGTRGSSSTTTTTTTTAKGTHSTAVQVARREGSAAAASGGIMMDSACQAPVPAAEACLKPYLDKPRSLLDKKVVVFWPRQGKWYSGRPTVYKEATKEHRVEYDDGDVRDHVLAHRSWGLIG